mgnify:CR=1 FL=1
MTFALSLPVPSQTFSFPCLHVRHYLTHRFLETSIGTDLRSWFADECFEFALTRRTLPTGCQSYMMNRGLFAAQLSAAL